MIYHISNSGNDAETTPNEGTPWATIAKLNTFMSTGAGLEPGDEVAFARGSVFAEKLFVPTQNDGTALNPIIFRDYGTGALPVFDAGKILTGWTSLGSGLYEITDVGFPADVKMMQVGGVNRPKKTGPFRRIDTTGTSTTLISTDLPAYDYSVGYGEVIVEKYVFHHDKCLISSRSGNTLTISAPTADITREGYRFIIQNLIETLTEPLDWMHVPATNKITIYSPTTHPDALNIRVSYLDHCIETYGNQYNEFHNLSLTGANESAGFFETAQYIKLNGLYIHNTGETGIWFNTTRYGDVRNCELYNIYSTGFQQNNDSHTLTFEHNVIDTTFPFFGAGINGPSAGTGFYGGGIDTFIRENRWINIGHGAIRFAGDNTEVDRNFIDGYCVVKTDNGGVYTYGGTNGQNTYVNQKVRNNIVIGAAISGHLDASIGLYGDDNQDNTLYENNLVIRSAGSAIYNHNSGNIDHTGNIVYDTWYGKLYIHNAPNELIRNSDFTGQVIVLRGKDEAPYRIETALGETDIDSFGTINNNKFILMSGEEFVAYTRHEVAGKRIYRNYSWAQWQTLRGKDLTSEVITLNIPEYDIVSLGANKFLGDGTFQDGATTGTTIFYSGGTAVREVDTTSKITGTHSLRARVTAESSTGTNVALSFRFGELEAGKAYQQEFRALAISGHQSLNVYFAMTDWPYSRLTRTWHFIATDTAKLFQFVVDKFFAALSVSMVIEFQSDQGDLYTDDISLKEITAGTKTDYEQHIKPIYNDTLATANIALPAGYWKDINDVPLTSPVSVPAFNSMLIVATEAPPVTYQITTSVFPEGAGSVVKTPAEAQESGAAYSLTATPAALKVFSRYAAWDGAAWQLFSGSNPFNGFISNDLDVRAEFVDQTFALTLSVDPAGYGTVSQAPSGAHASGTSVTLGAIAAEGKRFVGWYDGVMLLSELDSYSYTTLGEAKTIVGFFEDVPEPEPDTFQITTSVEPAGAGSITKTPAEGLEEGQSYTLTAIAASGKVFSRYAALFEGEWILLSASNPLTASMPPLDLVVRAEFVNAPAVEYDLTVLVFPVGAGTITGPGPYVGGAVVTLGAVASGDWRFSYWMRNGQVISEAEELLVTMPSENTEFTAFFESVAEMGDGALGYNLNGMYLSELGILPGQAPGSTIALAGAWDMPARLGKTHHEWGDQDGVQPYVREDEIFHGGRTLQFYGLVQAVDYTAALAAVHELYADMDAFYTLVNFATPFGSFWVHVVDEVQATHIGDGWWQVVITFREPEPLLTGTIPVGDSDLPGIDGNPFESLGLMLLRYDTSLNRPQARQAGFTAYGKEGFGRKKRGLREYSYELLLTAPTYTEFTNRLRTLYAMMKSPGYRTMVPGDGTYREVFNKDGFAVSQVQVITGQLSAVVELKLAEVRLLIDWNVLTDGTGSVLVDGEGRPLIDVLKKG